MNRRLFLKQCSAAGALATAANRIRQPQDVFAAVNGFDEAPVNGAILPDDGWNLWIDEHAHWETDEIYLPDSFDLSKLPVNSPTGGWGALDANLGTADAALVTLPCTVEQMFWGRFGSRSYTPDEYRYAADDPIPQNGAYRGVSWWWREIQIPASMNGQRILLHIRGARLRAEVYLNERLVGYSIMEELPFVCDLTAAARPGGKNRLAIRITNPGGRYDWVDGDIIRWGQVNIYRSHGFGGLDREMTLRGVPLTGHIDDLWVLNTPEPKTISAFLSVDGAMRETPLFEMIDSGLGADSGQPPRRNPSHRRKRANGASNTELPGGEPLGSRFSGSLSAPCDDDDSRRPERFAHHPFRISLVCASGAWHERDVSTERPPYQALLGNLLGLLGNQRYCGQHPNWPNARCGKRASSA